MILEFKLKSPTFIKMPVKLIAHEEKVELSFSSDIYTLSCISGVVRCNNLVKEFVTRGDLVDITSLCQNAGVLEIYFSLVQDGIKLKSWRVEPYRLIECEEEIKAIPAIEDMRQEITLLRYDIGVMKNAISELSEIIKNQTI